MATQSTSVYLPRGGTTFVQIVDGKGEKRGEKKKRETVVLSFFLSVTSYLPHPHLSSYCDEKGSLSVLNSRVKPFLFPRLFEVAFGATRPEAAIGALTGQSSGVGG
eukprot:TRINITY_DN27995_c0_g1_i1.p1 TRINITY_DN27995_c0_g1~~TRINITY_DN27995_c0_g1_i1.p1  ORF type:complete len:106 (-),score=8.81 TRINITY_DN27995_c0_g1_i1:125-442(-)